MWRLIYAMLPLVQPYVWLSISRMSRWSPERSARFRHLARLYWMVPLALAAVWLVIAWLLGLGRAEPGMRGGIALMILIAAYFICLIHAGIVLIRSDPIVIRMWPLIFAAMPVAQAGVWLWIGNRTGWAPDQSSGFRRVAAGYFALPPLLATAWLLLGLGEAGAWRIMIAAYVCCLADAGIVLFFREPAAVTSPVAWTPAEAEMRGGLRFDRSSLLLDIAVIYCEILGAVVYLAMSVIMWTQRYDSESPTKDIKPNVRPSLLWLIYGGVTILISERLKAYGVAAEWTDLMVLVAILAVPWIYYVCPWTRPWPLDAKRFMRITLV
jgi:hypothetical protein